MVTGMLVALTLAIGEMVPMLYTAWVGFPLHRKAATRGLDRRNELGQLGTQE